MNFAEDEIYHVYNQGNNQERVYHNADDYLSFLDLVKKHMIDKCEILCYCLMPNHFHFLIYTTKASITTHQSGSLKLSALSDGIRKTESYYAQKLNKLQNRSGSLFRQKTKAKLLERSKIHYPFIAFNYIHQNPLKASLVNWMEDWEYSSFKDFAGLSERSICNLTLARNLVGSDPDNFIEESYAQINPEFIDEIY